MKGKQLFILLVLAALVGGAWYYLAGRNEGSSSVAGGGGKVIQFPINDVAHLKIKTIATEVNLVKKSDAWVVQERADYPANFEQVSGLLRKILDLKTVQEVKVGASQMARMELEEPGKSDKSGTLVEMLGADGKTLGALILGKKSMKKSEGGADEMGMGGGFPNGRYVKPVAGAKVSLVSETFEDVEAKPEKWIAKDFLKIEGAKSIAVTGLTEAQKWTVTREVAAGEWKLADAKPDEKVDTNKTFSLGNLFSSPNITDVLAADAKPEETGLDKPTVAKIETFDGFIYEVKVGKANGTNIPIMVSVSANLPKERAAAADEKSEDKAKLDEEFKAKQKRLEEKLANEQKFAGRAYLVAQFTVDPLLKDRASLLPDKPAEPAPTPAPVPGATPPPAQSPGPAPAPTPGAAAPSPAPSTPPAPAAPPAPTPAPPPAPGGAPAPGATPVPPTPPAPVPGPAPVPPTPAPPAPPAPDAGPSPAPSPVPPAPAEVPKPVPNPPEKP